MSHNEIMQFFYFYWKLNEKKPTRQRPYFTLESTMTATLGDASGKMHHGILFDHRLETGTTFILIFKFFKLKFLFRYIQ